MALLSGIESVFSACQQHSAVLRTETDETELLYNRLYTCDINTSQVELRLDAPVEEAENKNNNNNSRSTVLTNTMGALVDEKETQLLKYCMYCSSSISSVLADYDRESENRI